MQYNQPFDQPGNPNAPYINGDPHTGTMGSIPPAASIEYPQREIVNFIAGVGLGPTNGDLGQMLSALKYADVLNKLKMGYNTGSADNWSMTCPALPIMPPPAGTAVWFRPGITSINGGTQFSLNGSAYAQVLNVDYSPVAAGDIVSTAWLLLFFDGNYWLLAAGSTRQPGSLPILHTNAVWYVDAAQGNDSAYDGTAAAYSGGKHGPFRTLQRASAELLKYNMNGYDQIVFVANGGYDPAVFWEQNGSGMIHLLGNTGSPGQVQIATTAPGTHGIAINGGRYRVGGFRISANGTGSSSGIAASTAIVAVHDCQFGPCDAGHIAAAWNTDLTVDHGLISIEPGAHCNCHMLASGSSIIRYNSDAYATLNIMGDFNVRTGFAGAYQVAAIQIAYTSVSGFGYCHGKSYDAAANAIINSQGMGNFPGDLAGNLETGSQHLP